MLEIQALTYNDLAPVLPIAGLLPEEGGTIGRGPQNAIVLPDPMRLVSRQHLQIVPEAKAQFRLVNISGANLVYINSEELLPGAGCMVKVGDRIYVGSYVLLIAERKPAATPNALAPVLGVAGAAAATGIATSSPSITDSVSQPVQASAMPSDTEAVAVTPPMAETDDFLSALFADPSEASAKRGHASEPLLGGAAQAGSDPLEALMQPMASRHQDPMQSLTREGVDLRSLTGKGDALINSHDATDRSMELLQEPGGGRIDALMGGNSVDPLAFFGTNASHGDVLGDLNLAPDSQAAYKPVLGASSSNHGSDLEGLFQTPEFSHRPSVNTPIGPATSALPDDFDAFLSPLAPETVLAENSVALEATPDTDSPLSPIHPIHSVDSIQAEWMPAPELGSVMAGGAEPLPASPMSLDDLLGPSSEDPLAALLSAPERIGNHDQDAKSGKHAGAGLAAEPQTVPPNSAQRVLSLAQATPAQAASQTTADKTAPSFSQAELGQTALSPSSVSAPVAPVANHAPAVTPLVATDFAGANALHKQSPAAVAASADATALDAALHAPVAAPSNPVQADSVGVVGDPLYQALLKGLGLPKIPDRSQLDANFMHLIGQLLRCTSQGTVDLMAGRAVVKREVKANVTLIAPERNNPLKFSPDGEVALMYLLGRTYPGFMQPAEAMSSAYLDLRAHQIGLVSGMRSALGHVLDKFDPANIDNDTIEGGLLSGFGAGRKAKLWDAYGRYYQATRDEAEDRFQEFFGSAFLKAYEEATESLKLSETPQENGWGAG